MFNISLVFSSVRCISLRNLSFYGKSVPFSAFSSMLEYGRFEEEPQQSTEATSEAPKEEASVSDKETAPQKRKGSKKRISGLTNNPLVRKLSKGKISNSGLSSSPIQRSPLTTAMVEGEEEDSGEESSSASDSPALSSSITFSIAPDASLSDTSVDTVSLNSASRSWGSKKAVKWAVGGAISSKMHYIDSSFPDALVPLMEDFAKEEGMVFTPRSLPEDELQWLDVLIKYTRDGDASGHGSSGQMSFGSAPAGNISSKVQMGGSRRNKLHRGKTFARLMSKEVPSSASVDSARADSALVSAHAELLANKEEARLPFCYYEVHVEYMGTGGELSVGVAGILYWTFAFTAFLVCWARDWGLLRM